MARRLLSAIVLAAALPLAACAASPGATLTARAGASTAGTVAETVPTPKATATSDDVTPQGALVTGDVPEAPPPVRVSAGGLSYEIPPYSYCYRSGCADGPEPPRLVDVGETSEVTLSYSLGGWSFTATFAGDGGRQQTAELPPNPDGSMTIRPLGHAANYVVTLFGRGKGQGDLVAAFRWHTRVDGPLAVPEALITVPVWDGRTIDSKALELTIANLAATPRAATARITLTSANGHSWTFLAGRDVTGPSGHLAEGSLFWNALVGDTTAGASPPAFPITVGPGPFTYQVTLLLDGRSYSAQARWPADVIPGDEPFVPLRFTPPLPALR